MRTTLTIDDHLMEELKALAYNSGRPLKKVINDTLRTGLACGRDLRPSKPYRCKTFKMGYPPNLNLDKALDIAAALEDDETARKLTLRK
jgi:hypothetical protein